MFEEYLSKTAFLDFDHPEVYQFCSAIDPHMNNKELLLTLYYKVRDGFLYDPYHLDLRPYTLKASSIVSKKRAWCVEKAILLAALFRKFGFPSRLGYAVVTNHIGVDKLTSYLKRDEIVFHGYVEVYFEDHWIKCTPAFDRRICRLSGVTPLDWDGENDSLFQEFEGRKRFMEYIHIYGHFADVPIELMNEEMKKYYPHLFGSDYDSPEFSFKHLWTKSN
jgi:transglutaminase-like putative cysteine protease